MNDPANPKPACAVDSSAGPMPDRPCFDHERLDVYRLELEFIGWATTLLEEVAAQPAVRVAAVRDQLDRASLSILLNTAEGNGKRQRPLRVRFFDDARGSATESAACLDALVAKRVVAEARVLSGKGMLLRIVAMLTKLVQRFEQSSSLMEESGTYGAEMTEGE